MDSDNREGTKKLERWQSRFLSLGGRVVIINSVLSVIPLYQTSIYKMPKWVTKKKDKIHREFLWGGVRHEGKAYNSMQWRQVCNSREHGGMGIT